jgi:hypothetical protein
MAMLYIEDRNGRSDTTARFQSGVDDVSRALAITQIAVDHLRAELQSSDISEVCDANDRSRLSQCGSGETNLVPLASTPRVLEDQPETNGVTSMGFLMAMERLVNRNVISAETAEPSRQSDDLVQDRA